MSYLKYVNDEELNIARGLVRGTFGVNKFGYNAAVPSNAFETVWDGSSLYTYIATPGTAIVTSSNTAADNGGTIHVFGLDSDYNLADEVLTIGGPAGSVIFKRVFRAVMLTATTGDANVGTVTVTVDGKSAAIITVGYAQTLMAMYTIPANHTGYLTQLDIGSQKDLENQCIVVIRNGTSGNVWNTKDFISTRGGFTAKKYTIPCPIPAKHDIEVRVKSSAISAISASFELTVIEDTFVESRRS